MITRRTKGTALLLATKAEKILMLFKVSWVTSITFRELLAHSKSLLDNIDFVVILQAD